MQSTQEGICQENLCGGVEGIQPRWNKGGPQQAGKAWSLPLDNSGTPGPLWGHTVYEKGFLQRARQICGKHYEQKIAMLFPKENPLKPLLASVFAVSRGKKKVEEDLHRDSNFYLINEKKGKW